MLLLFTLSFVFFPLEIQTKGSNYFAVGLFIVGQSLWQVGQCWSLPQPGQTLREFCFASLGNWELASSWRRASSKRWLWNPHSLWYCMDILTDCVSHRNTFHVALSTSACRAPISLAVIPLSSHISSQGLMQHHWKCACVYQRLQHKICRHLQIYFSLWQQAEWLNICQRFMMNSEVSSFKRQHPFFIGILYCLIYSFYL